MTLKATKVKRSRKQPDDLRVISSGRSCISATSNVAGALKMRISKGNPKHNQAFKNRPDLTQILHFRSAKSIAAPPLQPYSSGPSTPQITPITPTVLPGGKTQKEKRTVQVSDASDSETSSIKRSKNQLKKQKKDSSQDTHGYSTELPVSDTKFSGAVSPRNPNERWTIGPNPILPTEIEMTVLEIEQLDICVLDLSDLKNI